MGNTEILVTFTLNEVPKRQLLKYVALWCAAQLTEFVGFCEIWSQHQIKKKKGPFLHVLIVS